MDVRPQMLAMFLVLSSTVPMPARQGPPRGEAGQDVGPAWQELGRGMEKMHAGMRSIKPSGNSDIDFAKLMLPHHQAAIDMAKTELVYGKDPQMRRLAQEIIIDQQSETQLMQLWLKDHQIDSPKQK
jgi:uncharacterized protein (DUF305 family)